MNTHPPHLLIRIYFAALLGVFAFAPCYIAFWVVVEIAKAPLSTPVDALVGLGICIPLAYVLLLLAYRALTWRGRDSDDGLLPSIAMLALAILLLIVGVPGLVLTLSRGEYAWSLAAIGYMAAAIPVVLKYWPRRRLG